MKRALWMIILCALPAFAQQSDVRVRLLSLYHLKSVHVTPKDQSATMKLCKSCVTKKITAPVEIVSDATAPSKDKHTPIRLLVGGQSASEVCFEGKVRIESARATPIELAYPVMLRVVAGEIGVIAAMPMEEYVAAAVQGESSGQMPTEALKALVVTVRTYAVRFRGQHSDAAFDFCDSTHCQHVTLAADENVRHAVATTRGQILWDHGRPAMAFHHQDCGGQRAAASEVWPDRAASYLDARQDPYCIRQNRDWKSSIDRNDLNRALAAWRIQVPPRWDRLVVVARTSSGRVRLLRFDTGQSRGMELSASSFHFAIGRTMGWNLIKSDLYDVAQSGTQFTFTGRGSGHGVGLCQIGAIEMAREGKSYTDILGFYFPGTKIGVSAQGVEWNTIRGSRVDLLVTSGDGDQLLSFSDTLFRDAERLTGLRANARPSIQIFPSVELFRNTTGEPGWVAASTRGRTIRLQPLDVLRSRGEFESSLRHEFLHFVIESNARAKLPRWFREGLVLYLSNEPTSTATRDFSDAELESILSQRRSQSELRAAYAASKARVAALVAKHGREKVLSWLSSGMP